MAKTFTSQAAKQSAIDLLKAKLAVLEAAEIVGDDDAACKFELVKGSVYTVKPFGSKTGEFVAASFGGIATLACGKGGANQRKLARFVVSVDGIPTGVINVSLKDIVAEGDETIKFNAKDELPVIDDPVTAGADDTVPGVYLADNTGTNAPNEVPAL